MSLHFYNEFYRIWVQLDVDWHLCSFIMQRCADMIIVG